MACRGWAQSNSTQTGWTSCWEDAAVATVLAAAIASHGLRWGQVLCYGAQLPLYTGPGDPSPAVAMLAERKEARRPRSSRCTHTHQGQAHTMYSLLLGFWVSECISVFSFTNETAATETSNIFSWGTFPSWHFPVSVVWGRRRRKGQKLMTGAHFLFQSSRLDYSVNTYCTQVNLFPCKNNCSCECPLLNAAGV